MKAILAAWIVTFSMSSDGERISIFTTDEGVYKPVFVCERGSGTVMLGVTAPHAVLNNQLVTYQNEEPKICHTSGEQRMCIFGSKPIAAMFDTVASEQFFYIYSSSLTRVTRTKATIPSEGLLETFGLMVEHCSVTKAL